MIDRNFTIHHLSDIHFGSSHYRPGSKSNVIPTPEHRNASAYLNHLTSLRAPSFPDLIIISGDLTTIATEEEMDAAFDFLQSIVNLLVQHHGVSSTSPVPRLLIVPGNHDVDWLKDTPMDRHKRYSRRADGIYPSGYIVSSMYHNIKRDPWFDFGDDPNLFVCLLNSTHYGGAKDPVLAKVYEHIRAAAGTMGLDDDALVAFRREVQRDPGFVLENEIHNVVAAAGAVPSGRVKIAVVHHNPNHVPTDDVEAYDTIVNAGRLKTALLQSGFDLVLHGHRHVFHCSLESHPSSPFNSHYCFFVGADSLGCKEQAPFLEIKISEPPKQSDSGGAEVGFAVREFELSPAAGYSPVVKFSSNFARQRGFDPADAYIKVSADMDPRLRTRARNIVTTLLPRLQTMQSGLMDWKGDSAWIRLFHFQLHLYHQIFATDIYKRDNVGNSSFHRYLREQYTERLKRMRDRAGKVLRYSPDVIRAAVRTQWQPNPLFWPDYEMQKAEKTVAAGLEVVRILIVDRTRIDELELRNLDFDHAMCAIPLFVIDARDLPPEMLIDFAIGMNGSGVPIKACAYDAAMGQVTEQQSLRAYDLLNVFEKLLAHKSLSTVERFLGAQPMLQSLRDNAILADQYAKHRQASPQITRVLEARFPDGAEAGVDLCCGTGNYTIPFLGRFRKLAGVDISPEMLSNAQRRSDQIEWIKSDAKETPMQNGSFDAAWMISALHYFQGEEQKLLFEEIHRILKPGGVFIGDTEFSEQHPSLWIAEYFPSLRDRFRGRLFSRAQYQKWLEAIGFTAVFETYDYYPEQGDAFLRIGQHKPDLYLDENIQAAIPAFQAIDPVDRKQGFDRLKEEIANGEIQHVMARYKAKATLSGDIGFIIATRK
jgi:ubiquinone/menaquinone biosynthesis C-methylase UbiE/3',5'-cyclic AMP phosphodiesterase CpdA